MENSFAKQNGTNFVLSKCCNKASLIQRQIGTSTKQDAAIIDPYSLFHLRQIHTITLAKLVIVSAGSEYITPLAQDSAE